ncbi:CRISPR-associated protein [Metallosphaera tengchongensis]|uniref:CRISPR-associated protein n=1 Tax=Metallosphaera tengchongensis TaxID=1532350 RepID=A0A6N0NXT6_9CREN|nr:CRISPR-associated ring nuclease Crn1 [Metallosphaera tengchongensis]QKR00683.1 CRISPR-associated protein [Metallosphaera tengchongensis]
MAKLIATLGTSPGGVFETYVNLTSGNYEGENAVPADITEVYVIRTTDKSVEFAWKLVKAIFACCKGEGVNLADIPIPIQDINSTQDFKVFKSGVLSRISVGDYVDFTGGRKAMGVAAALSARERGAHVLTTIIPQGEYNRISEEIKGLTSKENLVEMAGKGNCSEVKDVICRLVSKNARTVLLY